MEAAGVEPAYVIRKSLCLLMLGSVQTATANQAEARDLKLPAVAFIGAQGLDLASTRAALNTPGTREANPLMGQSFGRQLAVKSATTVGILWWARHIERSGRPRAAKVILYVSAGALTAVAARNYRIAAR